MFFILSVINIYAQAVPRAFIDSDGFFDNSNSNNYRYQTQRRSNSYQNSLIPQISGTEKEERMHRKFDEYVEKQKVKDIYVMLGINEYNSDLDSNIAKGFSLAVRFNYEEILEDFLNIEGKHFYPYFTIGSKSITFSPFSYAVVDTEALKLYVDPLIPMINIEGDGDIGMASGLSAGYYHDKYSSWGIEGMIKYIWLNPYQEVDYVARDTLVGRDYEDIEKIATSDKYRFFWGLYLVYRF
jgi:hypothetical protein